MILHMSGRSSRRYFLGSPFLEVVGTARDGKDALEKVEALNPDVVTCDQINARDGRRAVRA